MNRLEEVYGAHPDSDEIIPRGVAFPDISRATVEVYNSQKASVFAPSRMSVIGRFLVARR